MSKGSTRRPTNEAAFQANYMSIFGKKVATSSERVQKTPEIEHCQHPNNCANPFCNCEVKHDAK